jgi:hypothetical protein
MRLLLKFFIISLTWLLCHGTICFAAGSVSSRYHIQGDGIGVYQINWVAEDNGTITSSTLGNALRFAAGVIYSIVFVPSTGATAPDDEHDILLKTTLTGAFDHFGGTGVGLEQSQADASNNRTPSNPDGGLIPLSNSWTYYLDGNGFGLESGSGTIYIWVILLK